MGFNFPNSPTNGQTFTPVGGYQYVWDGVAWRVLEAPQLFATAESRNRIVNGAMQIAQEYTTAVSSGFYSADQWQMLSTLPTTTSVRNVLSPYNQLGTSIATPKPALAVTDYWLFRQNIEGVRTKDFGWGTVNAEQVVLRFEAYATAAGTYAVSIKNDAADRSFLASYTVGAGAWTTFDIAVPGDTTGTWLTATDVGLRLDFSYACGSNFFGVAGWQAGNKHGITGMSNGASVASSVYIRNVGLYLDPDKTGLPPKWVMPDEAEELLACQRYYQKINALFSGQVTTGTTYYSSTTYPVPYRATPALTGVGTGQSAFPAAAGAFQNTRATIAVESRVCSTTAGNGIFESIITANARM